MPEQLRLLGPPRPRPMRPARLGLCLRERKPRTRPGESARRWGVVGLAFKAAEDPLSPRLGTPSFFLLGLCPDLLQCPLWGTPTGSLSWPSAAAQSAMDPGDAQGVQQARRGRLWARSLGRETSRQPTLDTGLRDTGASPHTCVARGRHQNLSGRGTRWGTGLGGWSTFLPQSVGAGVQG